MSGLLACPFCGGRPQLVVNIDGEEDHGNNGGSCIECQSCKACSAVVFGIKESPITQLREMWNRRAKSPSVHDAGARGGRSKSQAKVQAARENGKRGGRPKKPHANTTGTAAEL